MSSTPKKIVSWALDVSMSPILASPGNDSSVADTTSSSLPYINSQLIAHGFTHKPGLSLDGTSKDDAERVVKCLLAMLGQRVDDMSRTEDLTTKMRTLSYDHERLMGMYRAATEKAANAEREMNIHKTRLSSANRTLQTAENAHKQTSAELQRTRSAIQSIRATHQAEIKKLEKEKERVMERWSKLADTALAGSGSGRAGTSAVGFKCANLQVVEASDVQLRGKGSGFLEVSLEQAEEARNQLFNENIRLRSTIASAANELQMISHLAQCIISGELQPEPPVLSSLHLFPIAPVTAASDKLKALMNSVRQAIEQLGEPLGPVRPSAAAGASRQTEAEEDAARASSREIERLQGVIRTLRAELDDAQSQSRNYATQMEGLLDRFAEEQKMVSAASQAANTELEQREREFEEEQQRFAEAAVKLGKEKAVLEAERIRFLEEKRSWQVQAMLADFPAMLPPEPPTPSVNLVDHIPPPDEPMEEPPDDVGEELQPEPPSKPARKSPRKAKNVSFAVTGGATKKLRTSRNSPGMPKPKIKEKEKLARKVAASSKGANARAGPSSFKAALPPAPKAMPPVFVLPPPSPASKLPSQDPLLSAALIPPLPKLDIVSGSSQAIPNSTGTSTEPLLADPTNPFSAPAVQIPTTPTSHRVFPSSKAIPPRVLHAYSPVKPSPLSRILMLSNSPDSPENQPLASAPTLGSLSEEDERMDDSPSPTPMFSRAAGAPPPDAPPLPQLSLAAQLGVEEDDEPLTDKMNRDEPPPRPSSSLGHYKDKGKGRADQPPPARTRSSVAAADKKKSKTKSSGGASTTSKVIGGGVSKKTSRPTTSKVAGDVGIKPATKVTRSKVGPRRVPIGSSEAGPVPAWKG